MTEQIIDSIKKFGASFQSKTIACLLSDKPFLEQIVDIIDKNYYESPADQWIVSEIIGYYLKYKNPPSLDAFKVRSDLVEDDVLKASIVEHLKSAFLKVKSDDMDFVKEQFLEFCKNQKLKSAIIDSVDLLKVGQYDQIKHLVDSALKAGAERNLGHDYVKDFDHRMSDMARITIPTNWELIDDLMDGGLGAGELGVIVGAAGGGKCVGPNTEIEIKYHEIGVTFNGNTGKSLIWLTPFNKYKIDDKELYGWQVENFIWELSKLTKNNTDKIRLREKTEVIKIKDLFFKLEIENKENAIKEPPFQLEVKTPFGFKKIRSAFRTENQNTVTTYFGNNKTLKTSYKHRVKSNGEWKHIKDLRKNDKVETEHGLTYVKSKIKGKKEILFDISVEDVHCYFSNGIVSHNSWCLAKLGAEAMKQGKNVIYYTLELTETYIGRRFDACFTGVDFQDVPKNKDKIRPIVDKVTGNLKIKYFPLKTISANSIKVHAERVGQMEWKPDLIIVDYADILRPLNADKNSNSYKEVGSIYEELKMVAGEMQIPIWTASQANRGANSDDIIEGHSVADSYRKIMTADFVMSVSRKVADKTSGTARFHIIKNRFGADGCSMPSSMNTSNGDIKIYLEKSDEGQALMMDMKNGEKAGKKQLFNNLQSFLNKKKPVVDDSDDGF